MGSRRGGGRGRGSGRDFFRLAAGCCLLAVGCWPLAVTGALAVGALFVFLLLRRRGEPLVAGALRQAQDARDSNPH